MKFKIKQSTVSVNIINRCPVNFDESAFLSDKPVYFLHEKMHLHLRRRR